MLDVPQTRFSNNQSRVLAFVVIALLTVLIIYNLYSIFVSIKHPLNVDISQENKPSSSANSIVALHLFGNAPHLDTLKQLPLSNLPFNLTGVMKARTNKQTEALIVLPNGKETVYHIGEHLPGGSEVVKILDDRVIVRRDGRLEKLLLRKV